MLAPKDPLWIPGPAGKLETIYIPATHSQNRGVAVINHPNPIEGGTNTNKVIQTAAKALSHLGFHCYLPNLRGVGNSEGEHSYGLHEAQDCTAVIDYARNHHPNAKQLIITGFSFGGYVATLTAPQRVPDLLLLIGPAVGHYAADHYKQPAPNVPNVAKTIIIHGADDEIVDIRKVLTWAAPQNLPVIALPDSSHFFHGKLIPLRDTILRFAPAILDSPRENK